MAEVNAVEKQPVTQEYLKKMDAYWRAANYLGAAQLYLLDNPLLREPLTMDHIKKKIVGHWGTVPGQNREASATVSTRFAAAMRRAFFRATCSLPVSG